MGKNAELNRQASRRHYERNKPEMVARAKAFTIAARNRNREYIKSVKEQTPCQDCGFKDHRALQFHHLSDKDANIGDSIAASWGMDRLKREIEKCIVLCANCHHIRHYEQRLIAGVKQSGSSLRS